MFSYFCNPNLLQLQNRVIHFMTSSTCYSYVFWDWKVHPLGEIASDVEHQCCWSKVTLLMYYTLYLQRSGTPSKRFKRSERSTPTAIVAPTRIDSLRKLSELTKG